MPGGGSWRRIKLRAPLERPADRDDARRGGTFFRRRRQRLRGLVLGLRAHDLRAPPPAHRRRHRQADRRGRHALHFPSRARLRGGPQAGAGCAQRRPCQVRQLGVRGHPGGHAAGPGLHRQRQDPQVGGWLPRLSRLPRALVSLSARGLRAGAPALYGALQRGHSARRWKSASSRGRTTISTRWSRSSSRTGASWPPSCASRSWPTRASSPQPTAGWTGCAASATSVGCCSSSTRSSPAFA